MAWLMPTGLRQRVLWGYCGMVCVSAGLAVWLWPAHWRAVLVVGTGASIAGWVTCWLTTWHLRQSFHKLRETTDALSRGDFRQPIDEAARQDFVKLACSLDRLVNRLRALVEERERLRQRLTRSEKLALIGELAATLAHEINNPLDGLQNCTHIIRRDPGNVEQTRKLLDLMEAGLYRIEMSVQRLVSMARDAPPVMADVCLDDVVRDALLFVQPRLDRAGIDIVHDPPDPSVRVRGDRNQLAQVLINLFINAADAMPQGGKIVLRRRTQAEGRNVVFEVSDTGCGIPPDVLPHIFEPFYTTKSGGRGTGLGLAVAARILEAHGAKIEVTSAPGRGTRFTIILPAAGRPSSVSPEDCLGVSHPPSPARTPDRKDNLDSASKSI